MSLEAELAFHLDVLSAAEVMRAQCGHEPTRFLDVVTRHGGPDAARRALDVPLGSDGFTALWQHERLELSVEALAWLPWYQNLFTQDQLDEARDRLDEFGFDVDGWVRDALNQPPTWWRHPQ